MGLVVKVNIVVFAIKYVGADGVLDVNVVIFNLTLTSLVMVDGNAFVVVF